MKGGVSYDIIHNTDTHDNNAYANNDYRFQYGWNDIHISIWRRYRMYRVVNIYSKALVQYKKLINRDS